MLNTLSKAKWLQLVASNELWRCESDIILVSEGEKNNKYISQNVKLLL